MSKLHNSAIILAAGNSTRFGKSDKLFATVGEKPLLYWALAAFNDHPQISEIILVLNSENRKKARKLVKDFVFSKVKHFVVGSDSRQNSLKNGLKKIKKADLVVVHNGANPLPSAKEITRAMAMARKSGACIVGHFLNSTLKEVSHKHIVRTHDRRKIFAAETPQVLRFDL